MGVSGVIEIVRKVAFTVITRQSPSSNAVRDRVREAANAAIIGARYANNELLNTPAKILPLVIRSSRLGIDMSGWIESGLMSTQN